MFYRLAIILQVYLHQNLLLFLTMPNSPYALFASIFATMFTFNQIGVVTERIIATFYVKSYENSRRPLIFVMIIIPVSYIRLFSTTVDSRLRSPL